MNNYIPSTFDNASLSQLREDAKDDPGAKADEVSKQFEALFVNMLLKAMRKATQRSDLLNSEAARSFESMFDQEIANKVSHGEGIGLADTIKRQLFENNHGTLREKNGLGSLGGTKSHAIKSYQNQPTMPRRLSND